MSINKITAIVNEFNLNNIEEALLNHGVNGFTVTEVKGRGSYCNNYTKDKLVSHNQIEIFSSEEHAPEIAKLIMEIADVGMYSEGLIAITPVDSLQWIYQQTALADKDFNFNQPLSNEGTKTENNDKENNHE